MPQDWFAQNAPAATAQPSTQQPADWFEDNSPENTTLKLRDQLAQSGAIPRGRTTPTPYVEGRGYDPHKPIPKPIAAAIVAAPIAANPETWPAVAAAAPIAGRAILAGGKIAAQNPFWTAAAIHLARELGVPVPKVLDIFSKFGEQFGGQ